MRRQPSQIWLFVLRVYVVINFLFIEYFFLCGVRIIGMGMGAVLLIGAIGNMKLLDFLDLS